MSSRFPTPEDMRPEDYARLGLRSGLEVHQQLNTERKLFCRCPAHVYTNAYHAEVLRHMRPTLSELGEYDGTALMEFKTRKNIIYRIHRSNVCTYELDDAPPFEMNDQALEYAVEISLSLGLSIVGEVHVARKQYLDGSIPTGFQRTAIIGVNGEVPYKGRKIGIQQLSIEEDSCREVSDVGHLRIYNTSRLSVPLIEIVTLPDMRTPTEVAEVAHALRKVTRGTGRARKGIGAARQDVNVSVTGGTRIEIKGVHRIPLIPRLVHYEALRQKALLDIRDRLAAQGRTLDGFAPRVVDLSALAGPVSFSPIQQGMARGGVLHGVVLPGFSEALNTLVGPDRPFAQELADQVRVVACLDKLPNLIHHPSPSPELATATWTRLRTAASAGQDDALVLVWGPAMDVETAAGEIIDRARQAFRGVPQETRQARSNGTTGFERVLPGAERMYPDTDLPPIVIPAARADAAAARIPPPAWEQERRFAAEGMKPHQSEALVMEGRYPVVAEALQVQGVSGAMVAEVLLERSRQARRAGVDLTTLGHEDWLELLGRLGDGRLAREAVPELLPRLASAPAGGRTELLDAAGPPALTMIKAAVAEALRERPRSADPEARRLFWMGRAMHRLRHRAPGRQVAEIIQDRLIAVEEA
ncbi:MAG: Glu-tRNA(Gln) amidotransferase subunit GatE [Deltaproteobacteria bacterium]|nr:Glu-tRNA(Gln) amidotransferase subunit GatE [Deltaproteobacteria bacterium]